MNKKVLLVALLAVALVYGAATTSNAATTAPTAGTNAICAWLAPPSSTNGYTASIWSSTDNACALCATGCLCATAGAGGCDGCSQIGWIKGTTTCTNPVSTPAITAITGCTTYCADAAVVKTAGCQACSAGYVSNGANGCSACPTSCGVCTYAAAGNTCTTCLAGFYLKAAVCTACPITLTNCGQCDSTGTTCTACSAGFYMTGGNCVACGTGAATCSVAGTGTSAVTTILSCVDGYYLKAASGSTAASCVLCGTNCRTCTAPTGTATAATCTTCNADTTNFAVTQDWNGFYLSTAGACTACTAVDANAYTCSATAPLVCNSGFALANSKCVKYIPGCTTYAAASTASASICTTCANSGIFHQNQCLSKTSTTITAAFPGCATITSATAASTAATCTLCPTTPGTWVANSTGANWTSCYQCDVNGTTCAVSGSACVCTGCAAGYYLNTTSNTCVSLAAAGIASTGKAGTWSTTDKAFPCITTGTTACADGTGCASGFWLKTVGSAVYCMPCTGCQSADGQGCSKQTGGGTGTNAEPCTSQATCNTGYVFATISGSTNACTACSSGCTCPATQINLTTSCAAEPNCAVTVASNKCATCKTGYYPDTNGQCQLCTAAAGNGASSSCVACTAASATCTACSAGSGFTLQSKVCVADANCVYKDSVGNCLTCQYGYTPNATTGVCTACASSACTQLTCTLPPANNGAGGGAGGNNNNGGTTKASSVLTFALSALLALLVILF